VAVSRLAGRLVLLIGVLDLLPRSCPGSVSGCTRCTAGPGVVPGVARSAAVLVALLLLMLARGGRAVRAERLLHLTRAEAVFAVLPVVLLLLLVAFRRDFYARGDPRTRWRALR